MESQQYVSEYDKTDTQDVSLQGSACSTSESRESLNEEVENEKLDLKSNIVLPADCFTAVSMPKNWSQVERLKQQRLLLHQQLFSQKLNVKSEENYIKMLGGNFEKIDENGNLLKPKWKIETPFQDFRMEQNFESQSEYTVNNDFDAETDSSDSSDYIPRLHISESDTIVENESRNTPNNQENNPIKNDAEARNKSEEINWDKDEKYLENVTMENELDENISSQNSLNNSDLCDISASKINEALFNTICSVSENKKREELRIKEVLNSLKNQAEVKENEQEHLSYKIEKPLATASMISNNTSSVSLVSNTNCDVLKHFPDSNLKVVSHGSNIASLSSTQYVGLPVDVENLSKKDPTCTDRVKNLSSNGLKQKGTRVKNLSSNGLKQKGTTVIDSNTNYGSVTEHTKEPDYRNIALQKMLAFKRLSIEKNEIAAQNNVLEKSLAIGIDKNESENNLQSHDANFKDSEEKKENCDNFDSVKQVNTILTHPKKSKISQELKELRNLKREVLTKRMQAVKLCSSRLQKELLDKEQKLFEAKQKVLQAEIKCSEHKLEMAKKGYLFPKHRIFRRYYPLNVATDDSTDTDEELIENECRNSETKNSPNKSESATENGVTLGKVELADENFAVKNKTSPNEVMFPAKNDTVDQIGQHITECKLESTKPKIDQIDKDTVVWNHKKNADSILRNCVDTGKEQINNVQDEPAGKVCKENKLRLGLKHKKTCKIPLNSAKIQAKENNISKRSNPVQVIEKNVAGTKAESSSTSFSHPIAPADSQLKQPRTSFPITISSVNNRNTVKNHLPSSVIASNTTKLVLPQTAVMQNAVWTPIAIKGRMQKQSINTDQSKQTNRFILPSGFVKDESTNQMFHTYHFNGQTFAMIDNKLYQIHLKCTDGKTKTVIGALIPTVASTSSTSARPGLVSTEFTRNFTSACSKNTVVHTTNFIPDILPSNSNVRLSSHNSQKPMTYRIPMDNLLSAAQPNQPLNLLIVPTNSSSAATQSTQVIKQPLMHAFGSHSNIRAHLQQSLGRKVYTTRASSVENKEFGKDVVSLPVTFTQSAGFQYGNNGNNHPIISVPDHLRKHQRSPVECNNVRPTSAFTSTMHQVISPRTAKSLLTNKTYVMVNTSEKSAQFNVQSKRSIEFSGSVILSSPSKSTILTSQKKQNSPSFDECMASSVSKCAEIKGGPALSLVAATKQDNSGQSWNDLTEDNSKCKITENVKTKALSETTASVVKPTMENCQQNISSQEQSMYALRSKSPAKICSSMDSCIYTTKRKRKGTPLKKIVDENLSIPPKVLKMDEMFNDLQTKEIAVDKNVLDKDINDKEIGKSIIEKTEPVPFLDYPARIVSTNQTGCSKKLVQIVASPNSNVRSGQNSDTSLDEEKIANMISFANQLEEESCMKQASTNNLKKNRLFKKRAAEDVQIQDKDVNENSAADSEQENEEVFNGINGIVEESMKSMIDLKETEPKQTENNANCQEDTGEHALNYVEKIEKSEQHKDRNMFDDLEQFVSKQNSMSESCNESSASYDSSDVETYEKFVSSRKNSDIMKPKSQFIESYYTNQGMKELRRRNLEPTYSVPVTGSFVISESSPKVMDLESKSTKSSPKEVEMEFNDPDPESKTMPLQRTSLCSKSTSSVADIRQNIGPVEVKYCSEGDMAVQSKQDVTRSLSEINQKSFTVGGKQVKKLIKTKFIILKGDICERWFDIKRRMGFGEMSDPKFIHYLLWSEDERHKKKTQTNDVSIQTDECWSLKREQAKETLHDSREVNCDDDSHADLRNSNNADSLLDDKTSVSDEDFEATIVNVTDTPMNSPMLSDTSSPVSGPLENNIFFNSPKFSESASLISSPDKHDGKADILHGMMPDCLNQSRKRHNKETKVKDEPTTKKQYPILSCATQRQMQWAVSLFREWLREKGEENTQFEHMDSDWLNDRLAKFYTDALSHEGTPYSTNILQTFRRALSLYLTSNCSSQNVRISISQDQEYRRSNEILTELVFTETHQNNVTVKDHVSYPLTDDDMKKLYSTKTLSDEDPTSLMFKVWFDITYHLCKRNLPKNFWRSLTKRSLVLDSDVNGVFYSFADYVYIPPDEEPGKMYATPNDPEKCPVRSTSFYLSKLCANCDALFQCSKRSWHKLQERWYLPVPVSREKLDKIMCRISEQAQLSRVYDSSCVILTAKLKDILKD